MTHAEQALGYDTVKHLDAWLNRECSNMVWGDVLEIRARMMDLAAHDDVWLDRGWQRVFDQVKQSSLRFGF